MNCIRCRHDARCEHRCAETQVDHDDDCPKKGREGYGVGAEDPYWKKAQASG